uniref:Ependymin n=1 Tax=Takifugu rubripes TaxID=31033 RepID=A0A674N047_TAKRU
SQAFLVLVCVGALFRIATTCSPHCQTRAPLTTMAANVSCSGQISYDAFGQKIRVRSTGLASSETFYVDQLMLFRQKVYYEIDWLKSSCKKKPLDTAFIPMQVPFDAHATMQMFLGSSASWGMGVLVNSWSGVLPNNGYYTGVFTEIGCIPMTFFSYMPTSGWSMISTFNWVLGNTNPMDFAPPSFCAKSKLEVTETPDNMKFVIFTAKLTNVN